MPQTINPIMVRMLRDARHWTQDELAHASGLGLRTVQRAETDGTASLATQKSLAAAFEVSLDDLQGIPQPGSPWPLRLGAACGLAGALVGWGFAMIGLSGGAGSGRLSSFQADLSMGLISAATGLICAGLGFGYARYRRRLD